MQSMVRRTWYMVHLSTFKYSKSIKDTDIMGGRGYTSIYIGVYGYQGLIPRDCGGTITQHQSYLYTGPSSYCIES
jgi:hypothetical protein